MLRLLIPLLAAALLACPKAAPTTLAGTDDEKMDTLSAQLEEIRTRTEVPCSEACSLKKKVCDLSATTCDIAGHHADRADFQKKCITSQEDCAKFNDSCSACPK